MKYRKKPVVIEAVQYTGFNWDEVSAFCEKAERTVTEDGIHTLEGFMRITKGDYIIRGIAGEFYPCKPDIFKDTYDPVEAL